MTAQEATPGLEDTPLYLLPQKEGGVWLLLRYPLLPPSQKQLQLLTLELRAETSLSGLPVTLLPATQCPPTLWSHTQPAFLRKQGEPQRQREKQGA